MKQKRDYPVFTVSKKAETSIKNGHPWIFDTEIMKSDDEAENGSIVDVLTQKGGWLGTAILSLKSKIRLRIISTNANDRFDVAFWERRIRYAWEYRKTVMGDDISACRIIFGEADSFPGLTVDRFSDVLVTQVLSIGMERLKEQIFPLLLKVLRDDGQNISGIYERNDVKLRALEGLDENCGWWGCKPESASTDVLITENGIVYSVDIANGQKTGFFLDQKYNRREVARLANGMRVLDCFTHTGSFALNAAMGGASHVTAVDISQDAIKLAKENANRNNLEERMDFICANVFDLLPELERNANSEYNFIILDPPAFTKSRKATDAAYRGYKEINYRAMKLLPRGGYLATCSCSHFMDDELFIKMLKSASADANVMLRRVEARQQAPDHPVLLNVPETDYLKFYIFQVI